MRIGQRRPNSWQCLEESPSGCLAACGSRDSIARLVRAYDDAVSSLGVPDLAVELFRVDAPPGAPTSIAGPPSLLGHMDITPENVVFRDGRAAALIDFDLVQPATRVQEVCNLLLWWAPLMPVEDREPVLREVDARRRARLLVDAYALSAADRARVVDVARNMTDRAWHFMRSRAQRLGGGWARMWRDGAGDRITRRQRWLSEQHEALHAAITAQD
jgi:Ser/Thr protein kinase RdoA (MazF antagonist)